MIKYFSDKTGKYYDTAEEANRAEFELKEKENLLKVQKEREERLAKEKKEKALAERKEAAEKVDVARKAFIEAQKNYKQELENFCKVYGTYHYSTNSSEEIPSLLDWFSYLFK